MRHRFRPRYLVALPVVRFCPSRAFRLHSKLYLMWITVYRTLMLYEPHTCIDHKQKFAPFFMIFTVIPDLRCDLVVPSRGLLLLCGWCRDRGLLGCPAPRWFRTSA